MNVIIISLVYLLTPIVIILLFRKYKIVKQIGTVILAYAVGIVLALLGLVPSGEVAGAETMKSIQTSLQYVTIALAIPLLLFSCDFKLWTRSLPKTIAALLGGVISVILAIVSAFFIFRNSGIDDFANVAAMLTGIYTGGTMNFFALGMALNVDPTTMTLTYTFEMLVTFPLIVFIVAGGYKFFRWILPFKDESTTLTETDLVNVEDNSVENYNGIFSVKTLLNMIPGLLLSILFLAVGAGISWLITGVINTNRIQEGLPELPSRLNELIVILVITTLAIVSSFFKKVREIPKTFELGMFFILMFSIIVASQFDIYSIDMSAMKIFYFILYVLIISIVLHLIISRITRVPGDLFTVAHIALIFSAPFIPPVVGAMKNKKVLISGIVIGLVGYAIGTYLGVAISYMLNLF